MGKNRQLPVRGTCGTPKRSEGTPARKSLPSLALIVFLVGATMADFALSQGIGAADNGNAAILINEIMYHPQSGRGQPEDIRQEYVELYNRGTQTIDLSGWRLSNGVDFVFPDVTVGAGQYLVVAADVATFKAIYRRMANVVGGWDGKLSNSGERIELLDRAGARIDSIRYSDQGDWGVRELGPSDSGHRGWLWITEHDGRGRSLELINPALGNEHGRNWAASLVSGGTPGAINSVAAGNIAPLITDVTHLPVIPGDDDTVTVSARIIDEAPSGVTAALYYRLDSSVYQNGNFLRRGGTTDYQVVQMFDDGTHDDRQAGDGIYAASVPAQRDGAIVEFYIHASDAEANRRTWPAPSIVDGTLEQVTNAFYQVNDLFGTSVGCDLLCDHGRGG
ncbi:MAG: hypothetical protein AMJ65_19035 [Phycisphaerae bacterium SG8_4]|nr:MAG: hypothetical protein AMJ65_19035 [Phycisphaerae bacterium SG8_4]